MALDVFDPPRAPGPQSARATQPRVNVARFGDGYSQRSEDGLNATPRTMQPKWASLTVENAEEIENFLDAHRSAAFLWTPPLESVARKWRCVGHSRGYPGGEVVSLSANLEEVFDL